MVKTSSNNRKKIIMVTLSPNDLANLGTGTIITTGIDLYKITAVHPKNYYIEDQNGGTFTIDRRDGGFLIADASLWVEKDEVDVLVPGDRVIVAISKKRNEEAEVINATNIYADVTVDGKKIRVLREFLTKI